MADMRGNCRICGKKVKYDAANTILHLFQAQPWLNFIECLCPACEQEFRVFLAPDYVEWTGDFIKLGVAIVEAKFADDTLAESFAEVYERPLLTEQELTPRQEHVVAFFHYLLERGDTA